MRFLCSTRLVAPQPVLHIRTRVHELFRATDLSSDNMVNRGYVAVLGSGRRLPLRSAYCACRNSVSGLSIRR